MIGTTPGNFQRVMQLLFIRAKSSVEAQRGKFEIFFYFQQAITRRIPLRKRMFKYYFFLYCNAAFPSVGLDVPFLFTLYVSREHACYLRQKCQENQTDIKWS
jgi:hypothetical protein